MNRASLEGMTRYSCSLRCCCKFETETTNNDSLDLDKICGFFSLACNMALMNSKSVISE